MSRSAMLLLSLVLAITGVSFAPAGPAEFVDSLPIPTRIRLDQERRLGVPRAEVLQLSLKPFLLKVHRDLPEAPQWGYGGMSPGPTIEVERDQRLEVHWKNELPATHIYALPTGADKVSPDVRAVTHLHGAAVREPEIPTNPTWATTKDPVHDNDGWPDAWTVTGQEQIAEYDNRQSARTLWYHDHAMGSTGRNVAAGLIGAYEIHDEYERSLGLPSGDYDIPLMLQTRWVNPDGTLVYTPDIGTEFYGNAGGVNGKLYPYLEVEPRKYRFRFINASNARTYSMRLQDAETAGNPAPEFTQIGSDGGFLAAPVVFNDPSDPTSPRLNVAPAERADIIIDFSKYAGHDFVLANNGRDIGDIEVSIPEIMLFKVGTALRAPDTSTIPTAMKPIPRTPLADVVTTRQVVFNQMNMADGTQMVELNGKRWGDPIGERPIRGTTEIWELMDTLTDIHPFHMHLVNFQVIDRRLFDVANFLKTGQVTFLADAVPPAPSEMGWKDTIKVYPQMITRIIVKFAPYAGYYVYHCHILEHEDMDMMRPFKIVDP